MAHTWSDEQLAIFAEFATGTENLVIEALAGTGKTTTLLEGINHAPEGRILLAAFNKRIAEELQLRMNNPRAEAKTLHALGFGCVLRYWEKVRLCKGNDRAKGLTERACGGAAPDAIKKLITTLHTKGREIRPHATVMSVYDEQGRLVTPGDLYSLAFEFDCLPDPEWTAEGWDLRYVEHRALAAMDLAAREKPVDGIDFSDMIYLPVRNRWMRPTYDLAVVDEVQDMTLAQLELAQGLCAGRFVICGDPNQAIYGFRGADSQSMDRLRGELNAKVLPLRTTYRCGRRIVALAQRLVPAFLAHHANPEGTVSSVPFAKLVDAAQVGDFVLSRKNAPLLSVAMSLIRQQKRVRVAGRDIGAGLKAILHKLTRGKKVNSVPAFLEKLLTWEEKECDRADKAGQEAALERIHDQADTLRTLSDGASGLTEIEARIDALFTDDGLGAAGVITCSSVHKAKGLEADRVFVLRDTLYPKRKKSTPAQDREEANIEYVATTRAKHELVWVDGLPGAATTAAKQIASMAVKA